MTIELLAAAGITLLMMGVAAVYHRIGFNKGVRTTSLIFYYYDKEAYERITQQVARDEAKQ